MDRANEQRKRLLQDTEKMLYKIKARMHGLGKKEKINAFCKSTKVAELHCVKYTNTSMDRQNCRTCLFRLLTREFNTHQALNTAWDLLGRTILFNIDNLSIDV